MRKHTGHEVTCYEGMGEPLEDFSKGELISPYLTATNSWELFPGAFALLDRFDKKDRVPFHRNPYPLY